MRWFISCSLLFALTACDVEEIGTGTGSITVRNTDPGPVEVLLSDNDQCLLGLHSTVQSKTTRQFDVGDQTWACVGGRGMRVQSGTAYAIDGGAIRPE